MNALTEAALAVLVLLLHHLAGRRQFRPEEWHQRMAAVDADLDQADPRLHPSGTSASRRRD